MLVNNLMGEFGVLSLTDGQSSVEGDRYASAVIMDETVLTSISILGDTGASAYAGRTFSKGQVIYGQITELTVATGLVQLIKQHKRGIK